MDATQFVRRGGVEWRARVVESGCGLTEEDAQLKRHVHILSVVNEIVVRR